MAWTEDQITMLRKLWSEGHPASIIVEKMGGGLSRSSIIGKAHRLGLEARINPVDHDALFAAICDMIIDAPVGEPCSIDTAARAIGLNAGVAKRMWMERINATHGGDPR